MLEKVINDSKKKRVFVAVHLHFSAAIMVDFPNAAY